MSFFSVIIPLYNKESYIKDTIYSVLNQTFTDYEIIVIDDGSTDNSLSVLQSIDSSVLQIISQENRGLSASRNKGISIAKGKFVAFLDADDLWKPDYLNAMSKLIKNYPNHEILGASYYEKRNNKLIPIKTALYNKSRDTELVISDFFHFNYNQFILDQSSLVLQTDFSKQHLFNEKITYNEDVDFYLKSFVNKEVIYTHKPLMIKNFDVIQQLSGRPISDKRLPDLDNYQMLNKGNKSVEKFIDIQRYKYIIKFTIENNHALRKQTLKKVNLNNLTLKQRLMMVFPKSIIILLRTFKFKMLKYLNIRLTTY